MQNYEQKNIDNFSELPDSDIMSSDSFFPSPDNPPWNNWIAMGMWFTSVVFIAIFPILFLFPYLTAQPLDMANQQAVAEFAKSDSIAILLQVLSVFPAHLCTLFLAWLIVTNFKKYSFKETLGWEWNGFKIWHSFAIVAFFFVLSGVLVKVFGEPENDFMQMLQSSRSAVIAIAILATFTAPLVEEVIYRGILYSSLQKRLGKIWGVVFVTFLFALVHVPQYSKNFVPDFQTVGLLLLLSLTLTLIRVYTKNLLPCIVLHTVFNGIQSLILVIEPILRDLFYKQDAQQTGFFFHLLK